MTAYLEAEILDWAHEKGILGAHGRGTEAGQHLKTLEEVEELTHALADRKDLKYFWKVIIRKLWKVQNLYNHLQIKRTEQFIQ